MIQEWRLAIRPLTQAEQERGLRALEELERLDQEGLRRRGGKPFSPSWKLLDQSRDACSDALMPEE